MFRSKLHFLPMHFLSGRRRTQHWFESPGRPWLNRSNHWFFRCHLSKNGAVAKSSHICSSIFLFLGGQSVECRTLHFSVQAKPTHAESVIFVYGKQTCSGFVVLERLCQAVFGSNSAFPNRPSASRLQSFRILNAVARIKRRVSLLVFPRVRNLPNP